jgi:hypothetical protein
MITRLVSGGQTGVDRAAMDAAMAAGISVSGWCPKTRKAEDGVIPEIYPLTETPGAEYDQRTEWNVRDSQGTLLLISGTIFGGSLHTKNCCQHYDKPFLVVDLSETANFDEVVTWLALNNVHILNVAGPREGHCAGIYEKAKTYIEELLRVPIDSVAAQITGGAINDGG